MQPRVGSPEVHFQKELGAGLRQADLYVFERLQSTNDHLKANHSNYENGDVVWALEQTQGKGRQGRTWRSGNKGTNLTFSVLFRDGATTKPAMERSLWAALSVVRSLEDFGLQPRLKWPNDVLIGPKKISGILVEHFSSGKELLGVLGVGVNVMGDRTFLNSVDVEATSVWESLHHQQKPSLRDVLDSVLQWLSTYEGLLSSGTTDALDVLAEPLKKYSNLIGLSVRYHEKERVLSGVVRALDPKGLVVGSSERTLKIVPLSECLGE